MQTVADIIRAPKDDIKIGGWKSGKIPASAFPLNKRKFPHSSDWIWRVIEFTVNECKCRVLIRLNVDKSYYSSILAIEDQEQIQIICHHELHLSHLNWHCHFVTGNISETMPGVLRDFNKMRVYEAEPSRRATCEFSVTPTDALSVAAARFRFAAPDETPAQPELL